MSNIDCMRSITQTHLITVLLFQYKCIINGFWKVGALDVINGSNSGRGSSVILF